MMSRNEPRDGDRIPARLGLGAEPTESIDILGLLARDVTTTGSFDLGGVERTSLGKLLRALPLTALLVEESLTVMFSNTSGDGVDDLSDPLLGQSIVKLFPGPASASQARAVIERAFLQRKRQVMEAAVRLHGRKLWGRLHLRTLRMGSSRFLLVLIEDLTLERRQILLDRDHQVELRKARDELELRVQQRTAELTATNERMRLEIAERRRVEADLRLAGRIVECSNEAIMVTDPASSVVHVNDAFFRITGYSAKDVLGQVCTGFHWGPSSGSLCENIWKSLREDGAWKGEVWDRHKSGKLYPKLLSVSAVRGDDNEVTHYVAIFSDITKLKQTEKRLAVLAQYDSLTGLPNRILFRGRLRQAVSDCTDGRFVAVLLLDLDRFKNINETMGHRFGDRVLAAVGQTLSRSLTSSATAARLGGDEFAVVLPEVRSQEVAAKAASHLLSALSAPMVINRREVFVTASLGIALYPSDGQKVDILLQNADTALRFAKDGGQSRFRFFSRDMNADVLRQQRLEHIVRVGLMRGRFILHYQPVIDVATMRIVGAEGLLRWLHPNHGPVSAEKLVPIAEDTGLIIPLGEWVLRTACSQNRAWQAMGLPSIPVSVNFSARQIKEQNVVSTVRTTLDETRLDPSFLEIELTESTMLDDREATRRTLMELKKQGVGIAIDDFGTGYSSLSYLRSLPADKLKIDKSFVKEISSDPYEQAIVQAILSVAHSRELIVVAEGVETVEQFNFLRSNGCDLVQGYYLSRPMGADMFTRILKEGVVARSPRCSDAPK